jgi:hypothetical protein
MPMQTIQMPFRQRKSKLFRVKSMDVKVFALVFFTLSKTHKVGCNKNHLTNAPKAVLQNNRVDDFDFILK